MTRDNTYQSIIEHKGRHLRVLGPPASGKTTLLIERFRWLEASGRRAAVITYGRAQRDRLVDALLARDDARFGRVPVWTFPQLASEILSRAQPGMRGPLRELQEHVLLGRVLSRPESRLSSDLARIAHGSEFRRSLLDTLHTLSQNGLAAQTALRLREGLSARVRDVLTVYAAYSEALAERNVATFYDSAWKAARALPADPAAHPLGHCDAVLIDDFSDIDAGQYALLLALAPPDGALEVNAFADTAGARYGYRGTRGRFAESDFAADYSARDVRLASAHAAHESLGTTVSRLMELAGCDRPPVVPAAGALDAVIPVDATGPAEAPPAPKGEGQLSLFAAGTEAATGERDTASGNAPAELRPAHQADRLEVRAAIATDATAECQLVAGRISELLTDTHFDASRIAIVARDTHRYEQKLRAALGDVGVLLRAPRRGLYAVDDYIDAILALLDGAGARAYARLAASPHYPILRASLEERLDLPPRKVESDERETERIVAWLKKTVIPGGVVSMSRLLETVMRPVVTQGQFDNAALAGVTELSEEWRRYEEAVAATTLRPSLTEFRHARRMAAPARAADTGTGVRLLSSREAASESFDAVFVLGLSEGVCPRIDATHHYLPFAELQEALSPELPYGLEFHRARNYQENFRDEHALLLTSLTRARHLLHVTAPQSFGGDEATAPSAVVASLFEPDSAPAVRVTGTTLHAAARIAAALPESANDTARAQLSPVEVRWMETGPTPAEFAIDAFAMSPSQLDRYVKCPRLMFYNRVLGIEDAGSVHLTVGSLLHAVMEKVGQRFATRDALLDGLDESCARELVEAACAESRDPIMPADTLQGLAVREHVVSLLEALKGLEKGRCGAYEIGAVEFDEPFERDGHQFIGKVDRVDRTETGHIVIDYKTGSSILKQGKSILSHALNRDSASRYWQVPFYSYCLKHVKGEWPEAFYYYVFDPKKGPFVTGVIVVPEGGTLDVGRYYAGLRKNVMVGISPDQLDDLVDEIVDITGTVFAPRQLVERTVKTASCRNCYYDRLCGRKQ